MKILFAKYNRDRKKEFQLETVIYEENGEKYVRKKALTSEALAQINQIEKNYEILKENNNHYKLVKGRKCENYIIFPYIDGVTMSDLLVSYIKNGEFDKFIECLDNFQKSLYNMPGEYIENYILSQNIPFYKGKDKDSLENVYCLNPANLDLIFDNIIISNSNEKYVIDSEWVFLNNIPAVFIFFRSVYSFWIKYNRLIKDHFTSLETLLEKFNISSIQLSLFLDIEENYFQSFVYGNEEERISLKRYKKTAYSLDEVKNVFDNNKYYSRIYDENGRVILSSEGYANDDFREIVFSTNYSTGDMLCVGPVDQQAFVQIQSIILESEDIIGGSINYSSKNNFNNIQYSNNIIVFDNDPDFFSFISFNNEPKFFIKVEPQLMVSENIVLKVKLQLKVDLDTAPYYREVFVKNSRELDHLRNELSRQHILLNNLLEKLDGSDKRLRELENEKGKLLKNKEELTEKNRDLTEKNRDITQQIIKNGIKIKEYEDKLEEILQSTSWKITSPLRKIGEIVRK